MWALARSVDEKFIAPSQGRKPSQQAVLWTNLLQ
jgi:hypothetical protein